MTLTHSAHAGNLLGGILLISGSCIGAGMLGLPVVSALAGFTPSVFMLFVIWVFMATTGLLLLEVNLWFKDDTNLITMAARTLGTPGKVVTWVVFLFLFYCLLVAYIAGSGGLFASFFAAIFNTHIPIWASSLICTTTLSIFLYFGTKTSDHMNRILMAGLIVVYVGLLAIGAPHINAQLLTYQDWSYTPFVLPLMVTSFGYHNLLPSLSTYLQHNVYRLRIAILAGSALPLLIYILWNGLILGLVPVEGIGGFRAALEQGEMATDTLKHISGSPWTATLAQYFAFFAVTTSFLGVALSFIDFLADGLKIRKTSFNKIGLCALVLVPPQFFALLYPHAFLEALNFAGGVGAVILFGILPAIMVWFGRYRKHFPGPQLVDGGRTTLFFIILFAFTIAIIQIYHGSHT